METMQYESIPRTTSYQDVPQDDPYHNPNTSVTTYQNITKASYYMSGYVLISVLFAGISLGFSIGFFLASTTRQPHRRCTTSNAIVITEEGDHLFDSILLDQLPHEMFQSSSSPLGSSASSSSNDTKKHLLYLNHPHAYTRLSTSPEYSNDYFLVQSGFDVQINQAYCAVATSAAILNSLRFLHQIEMPLDHIYAPYRYATQNDLLMSECSHENVIDGKKGILTPPYGLSLTQVEMLFGCVLLAGDDDDHSSWEVEKVFVDPEMVTVDKMRRDLMEALEGENSRVLINYFRMAAGQVGGGHFSPIGSYHPPSDSFLILDTAKYKYPPVWVNAEVLHRALATKDECGTWDYPNAQEKLPSKLRHPQTLEDLYEAKVILGCEETFRGYIIVRKKKMLD